MAIGWIIGLALAGIGVAGLGALLWRWLSASWHVLDDEQLHELSRGSSWLRGWFRPKQRQLFYRRDKRGRFRRIQRW